MDLAIEKFANPPIREAVFIIDFARPISVKTIKQLKNDERLTGKYPIFQVAIINNLRINVRGDSSPASSSQELEDGLIFRTSMEVPEWVLQVRRNNILFHKAGNY